MGELPPNRRPGLCHFFGWPSRSSRAISEACRLAGTRQYWGRNHANRLRGRALAFGFQHRFRHFLDKQRNAVSALDDVLPDRAAPAD
jgi:hypothetical protein